MRREKTIAVILDVLFVIVPWGFSMPVMWKAFLWSVAWFLGLYLILSTERFNYLPFHVKIGRACILTVLLAIAVEVPIHNMWRTERAAVTEGDLELDDPSPNFMRIMEVGDSGAWFVWIPGKEIEQMRPAYDSGFKIEGSATGLQVSTEVRDWNGNLLLEMTRNHWMIFPTFCKDKNYTNESLEVLDNRGHVVFQLKILPDKIQIQGEWYDDLGRGVQVIKSSDPKIPGARFIPEDRKKGLISTQLIPPVFVYPSKDHWGEFAH
jgi:hypothetical protein